MTNRGFITLYRKLSDWEWYKDISTKTLFLHIILMTNHKPKKWKGINVDRGEFLTGRCNLAKDTGLSVQQVRTAINKLKSTSEITTRTTNQFTIIKLANYNLYQNKKEDSNQHINQHINKRITNEQPTDNQRITTTNNINNVNNITMKTKEEEADVQIQKNNFSDFDFFWKNYTPIETTDGKVISKGSRQTAFTSYKKAIAKHTPKVISDGLERYLKHCQANSILTCGATVFLNQERFLNDETVFVKAVNHSPPKETDAEIYNSLLKKYENEENENAN